MKDRFKKLLAMSSACVVALGMAVQPALACTSFILHSKDGGVVYGRTLEFGLSMGSEMVVVPRHLAITGVGPDGTAGSGLAWTTKYGAVGMNALGLPVLIDGMNEKGLAGGLLFFPGLADFQEVPPGKARNSIASYELLTYILTNFSTVAEVKEGLPKILVNRAPQAVFKMPVPVHVTLHDPSGASIVIEYTAGGMNIYDNPTGVMTNAPDFKWHVANLGNYLSLSAYDPSPLKIGSMTLAPPSTGGGAPGLPGDMSSPSRFVRAFLYSYAAPVLPTSDDAVDNAFHILNNFDIAPGIVRTSAHSTAGGGVNAIETTEWVDVADLKTKRYYVRTYTDSQSKMIDLTKTNLDGTAMRYIPVELPGTTVDLSQ